MTLERKFTLHQQSMLAKLVAEQTNFPVVVSLRSFGAPEKWPEVETWEGVNIHWAGKDKLSARMVRRFLHSVPAEIKEHEDAILVVGLDEDSYDAAVMCPPKEKAHD